jgi:Protein of unknown function (DUF3644)
MRATWRSMTEASRQEALQAADHYNKPKRDRSLEGFFIHMHIAWLYLLHAEFKRDGIDYRYWKGSRLDRIDGEPRTWELRRCIEVRWSANDPVRKNLELTIALRNKIEHRYQEAISAITGGYAQALLLNYEEEITTAFGSKYSLGDELRFPVFVGTFTRDGVARILDAQHRAPSKIRKFLADFDASLDPSVTQDPHYEFRIHLVPKTGPKTEADMSITFVREEDLTDEQREALTDVGRAGTVLIRERQRAVANADNLKPKAVVEAVQASIPFDFHMGHFVTAWRKLQVRPARSSPHPERTDERYCIYDAPHCDYVYTPAFVKKIIREIDTEEKFEAFLGSKPQLKPA